jgi:hypothetical protein
MPIEISKENARAITGAGLILANLMPIAGVLFLGWEPGTLLFVYWLESAVVGFFNVVKMAQAEGAMIGGRLPATEEDARRLADLRREAQARSGMSGQILRVIQQAAEARMAEKGGQPSDGPAEPAQAKSLSALAKIPLIAFFLLHYGIFMAVHGVFLYTFFGLPRAPAFQWLLTTFLLFTSHGLSYLVYFLGRGEVRMITPSQQMGRPYARIVVMQLTIVFGGMLIQSLQAPALVLVLLVMLKMAVDLFAHSRSHARLETAAEAA